MNKALFAIFGSFLVGTASGFVLGYCYMKKKNDELIQTFENEQKKSEPEKKETPIQNEIPKPVEKKEEKTYPKLISGGPAKIAMPGEPGIDYTKYANKVNELGYKAESLAPTDGDDTELEEPEENIEESCMETYEERVDRELKMINDELQSYVAKKGNSIDVLGKNNIDSEWPDVRYEEEELFYFICDDILTDAFGNIVEEEDLIGDKLRKFGWFQNGQEDIWVRNNPLSRDYHVKKIDEDYEEYFPSKKEDNKE